MIERHDVVQVRLPEQPDARDERRLRHSRHRLVCRRCGRTEDVDCAMGDEPCLTPSRVPGFVVDEAEIILWGLCPTCKPGKSRPIEGRRDVAR